MLFADSKLLFYVCTHEMFGGLFGDAQLFQRLQLTPMMIQAKVEPISGHRIDRALLQAFMKDRSLLHVLGE